MKNLPLNGLRAYAAVWRLGGVRAAARALDVTHSAVSRHLGEVENWIGCPLTYKEEGRKKLSFTAEGAALGRAVQDGLDQILGTAASLQERRGAGSVVVSTAPSFATRWLLPRLPRLAEQHPHIQLSVLADQRLEDFSNQDVDLAIRMGEGPWPHLKCELLMDERLYPVMGSKLWARTGHSKDPDILNRLTLLHDRDPQTAWSQWRDRFGPRDLTVTEGPRMASSDLLLRAAALNQGVALARHRLAADDLASGQLVRPFPGKELALEQAYWIVTPRYRPNRQAVKTVVEWLQSMGRET